MRAISITVLSLLFLSAFFQLASAQSQRGITVTPSILRLDLSTEKNEAELFYKNTTKNQVELSFSAQDFTELEEGGRVKFLEEKDAKNYKYGLTSWISFERQSLTLSPNEQQTVKVFIDQDKLAPGGHYASILAEIKQKSEKGNVLLRGILSSLLFVRTATGKEIEEASISSFQEVRSFIELPKTFLVRFKNSGNVELVPYGVIEIFDPQGTLVAKGILNEGSLITLPESVRRYDSEIRAIESFIGPGFYTVNLSLTFGKDKMLSAQKQFFTEGGIPFTKIIIVFGVALAIAVIRKIRSLG